MTDSAPLSPLHGKVALITGAGQGIGQGIAFSLAKRGVSIVAVGRTLSKCEKTVADIEARFNGKAVAIECDISNLDALLSLTSIDVPGWAPAGIFNRRIVEEFMGRLAGRESQTMSL